MSRKVIIIDTCEDCPHYHRGFQCYKTETIIVSGAEIPDDCPLDDFVGDDE